MANAKKHKERSKRSYISKQADKRRGFIIIVSHNSKNESNKAYVAG